MYGQLHPYQTMGCNCLYILNSNGGLTKPPMDFDHVWIFTPHRQLLIQLFIGWICQVWMLLSFIVAYRILHKKSHICIKLESGLNILIINLCSILVLVLTYYQISDILNRVLSEASAQLVGILREVCILRFQEEQNIYNLGVFIIFKP